jgi:hypothetical protein
MLMALQQERDHPSAGSIRTAEGALSCLEPHVPSVVS